MVWLPDGEKISTKRALALYTITIDRVYDSKDRRYAEDNRTESNCICTSKSEAEVTNNNKKTALEVLYY